MLAENVQVALHVKYAEPHALRIKCKSPFTTNGVKLGMPVLQAPISRALYQTHIRKVHRLPGIRHNMEEFPRAEVFEIESRTMRSPIIFAGFVGAGLVGPVAINHMIEKMGMTEVGILRSRFLPPSTVFMKGRLRHPFRFYANGDGTVCAIICEITLRLEGIYRIVSSVLDWAESKGSREIVILDGVTSNTHDDTAYCAAEEDLVRTMADKEIKMIDQGFILGIPGGILNECLARKIRGIALLAKVGKNEPDSVAAATLVEAVGRVYSMDIDTTELREEAERIKKEFSELSEEYIKHRKESNEMYM